MIVYIALGANLSNPKETFAKALSKLGSRGVTVRNISGLWQSPSWPPGQGHPDYLNAVAEVDFSETAEALLDILNAVELVFGRERKDRNAPRTLDLDILDFGSTVQKTTKLTLPHARMLTRGFVLFPLSQIAPDWTDPLSGLPIQNFIAQLPLKDVEPMHYAGKLVFNDLDRA